MKAVALISAGLDSRLAAKFIKSEGIDIVPLHFRIPFCHRARFSYNLADQIKRDLGAELKEVNLGEEFLEIVKNPKYGYGSNVNPCIDCKILMLRKAACLMQELGAKFILTGEVLGQRPMSQYRQALEIIEKRSGLDGLLLRPLSARLLKETIPEREHWVNRDRLLDFSGRTRRPQIELAKKLDIQNYPNASGGCLLTDPEFTKRLKELIIHEELSLENVELLKVGRHFRISDKTRLVVGRNERENTQLRRLARLDDYLFLPDRQVAGATSLGRGGFNQGLLEVACRITCRYCDLNGNASVDIIYESPLEKKSGTQKVMPLEEDRLCLLRI